MTGDARFEDGAEKPLNLLAQDGEDLGVISALVQDAVFPATEMLWRPAERRFALLLNRFRWEDEGRARHEAERVQSVLVFSGVQSVASQGIDRDDADTVLSVLSVEFRPDAEPPSGQVLLTLAGDGAIRLRVEAVDAVLKDVTKPYIAPAGRAPEHDIPDEG
ncbi:DUF2948 family protein [Pseudooceanicola sp. 216_PA32_1]|uniref:DUF2948 family protein n=1 Tax=Pseudooceanicola pacificus TaxID=2676438 RepID=A0A844WAR1_9RHOB|nr:DUF2948 family protein [Pseudooceanicola pacificus]MWB77778.1 DUF2948 family protein [Pseudooceanicola pacificus]